MTVIYRTSPPDASLRRYTTVCGEPETGRVTNFTPSLTAAQVLAVHRRTFAACTCQDARALADDDEDATIDAWRTGCLSGLGRERESAPPP